jgi:hypothetical protein
MVHESDFYAKGNARTDDLAVFRSLAFGGGGSLGSPAGIPWSDALSKAVPLSWGAVSEARRRGNRRG